MAAADRSVRARSLAAAAALHLVVFAALMLAVKPDVIPTGDAVPVTLVSQGPREPTRAEPSPTPRPARVEAPIVSAPPPLAVSQARHEPPPPAPSKPRLKPPPKPMVKPAANALARPIERPEATTPTARPARPQKAAADRSLDLDALQATLAAPSRRAPPRPSLAERGPAQVESAPHPSAAPGVSRAEKAGLAQLLNRLWNPNCGVEGGDTVLVSVTFTVGYDGRLIGRVSAGGEEHAADPVVQAAARRAIDAVHAVEPYSPTYRGAQFRINFDAKKACADG